MNEDLATKLVKETFNNPFDKVRFTFFIRNLFNSLEESKFVYQGNYIPDSFKPYICKLERIGKYEDREGNKIDILIVHLKRESSVERARATQRNFIARYLNGSRGGDLKDAALVAFHSDNPDDWRFSLVKMDYSLTKTPAGNITTKKNLTPAKRYSFLVGKNENTHTAKRQLLPILQDDINNPLLSDLENAFNIEVVTKEFFEKYRELFHEVKEELENIIKKNPGVSKEFSDKSIRIENFAKKLLGQIVFLYFLQKKGWFGVGRDKDWGTGPKNFLRQLFEKKIAHYDNFFNDILEPLFYEALATQRDRDFYSRFNCKIPFLNGGLFDPINDYDWVHKDILLSDTLFSNRVKTKEGDIGTGILDVFDRYNFTVKEDEPLDKEVAVDPEMLGKVFENLLEVKDRKSKGTYYTPREIVHYMCQESLINYLATEFEGEIEKEDIEILIILGDMIKENDMQVVKNKRETGTYGYEMPNPIIEHAESIDEKLENIKVCDPAIGSGAFVVGMMNEIIRARDVLTTYIEESHERNLYNFKRHAIRSSLFGVDIDPGAVDIAKLRLWLSLIVDEEDIKKIKPLPNLDFKIMQGNSLLEEYEGIKLFDENLLEKKPETSFFEDDEKLIKRLKERQEKIQGQLSSFYIKNPSWQRDWNNKKKKADRPTELHKMEKELLDIQDRLKKFEMSKKKRNDMDMEFKDLKFDSSHKFMQLKRLHNDFFKEYRKREKDMIREKINQVEWELIEATLKEHGKAEELPKLEHFKKNKIKPFFLWKLNFAEVFHEKGGFDVVIANPPYVRQEKIESKLKKIYKKVFSDIGSSIADLYIYFFGLGLQILREKAVLIYITSNKWLKTKYGEGLRKKLSQLQTDFVINFFELPVFEASADTAITKVVNIPSVNNTKYFPVQSLEKLDLNKIINSDHQIVIKEPQEWKFIKEDHLTLLDKFYFDTITLKDFCNDRIYSGIKTGLNKAFVLNDKIASDLINSESREIVKKYAKSTDIEKYSLKNENRYFLATGYDLDIPKKYHSAYEYLKRYKKELEKRQDQGKHWYNLRACKYYSEFEQKKIIYMHTAKNHQFYIDVEGRYINNSCYMIISDSKFLFFFLNSKLFNWFKRLKFGAYGNAATTGRVQLDYNKMVAVPIKKVSDSVEKNFEYYYNKIIKAFNSEFNNSLFQKDKVQEYEHQIDKLVYELYGLTEEEIRIVEGN